MILSYLGSKSSLLFDISMIMNPYINKETNFCDLFSGSGVVSFHYRKICKHVTSCDQELYSYVLCYALTKCNYNEKMKEVISKLQNDDEREYGLISMNFSPPKRSFFTEENAKRIDGCRQYIDLLYFNNDITYDEFIFLLASLLCSMSKIANTCGTFRAYLKDFSHKAKKPFVICPIHTKNDTTNVTKNHKVLCKDAYKVFSNNQHFDVVYMDPPYNNIQYGAYYSLLNYICKYDPDVKLQGVGICENYNKSKFAMKKTCKKAFFDLFSRVNADHIFMSYASYALLSIDELINVIKKTNRYEKSLIKVHEFEYKKYKYKKTQENNVVEYLIHISK